MCFIEVVSLRRTNKPGFDSQVDSSVIGVFVSNMFVLGFWLATARFIGSSSNKKKQISVSYSIIDRSLTRHHLQHFSRNLLFWTSASHKCHHNDRSCALISSWFYDLHTPESQFYKLSSNFCIRISIANCHKMLKIKASGQFATGRGILSFLTTFATAMTPTFPPAIRRGMFPPQPGGLHRRCWYELIFFAFT